MCAWLAYTESAWGLFCQDAGEVFGGTPPQKVGDGQERTEPDGT